MVLEYLKFRKSKEQTSKDEGAGSPVLNEADEEFLKKIAAESAAPSNREIPTIILDNGQKVKTTDAQIALMAGADRIPLPASPPEGEEQKPRSNYWSYMPSMSRSGSWSEDWAPYLPSLPKRRTNRETVAADLASAAEAFKESTTADEPEDEVEKERQDLTEVLDQLNLGATNNRTFSLSKESAKLMEDFTQVLKDVINGVPTAYDDMEKLLTRKDKEIRTMFNNMPPWIRTLVKSLPAKMTATLAPEVLAATSEKPGADAQLKAKLDPKAALKAAAKKRAKRSVPSLKRLITEQGAIAAMLRNILSFLKMRFPAFITGTNAILSIAVFILLFIFWYCHKRGRETRLEREAAAAAASGEVDLDESEANDTAMEESTILADETPETGESSSTVKETTVGETSKDATHSSKWQKLPWGWSQPDPKDVPLPKE